MYRVRLGSITQWLAEAYPVDRGQAMAAGRPSIAASAGTVRPGVFQATTWKVERYLGPGKAEVPNVVCFGALPAARLGRIGGARV